MPGPEPKPKSTEPAARACWSCPSPRKTEISTVRPTDFQMPCLTPSSMPAKGKDEMMAFPTRTVLSCSGAASAGGRDANTTPQAERAKISRRLIRMLRPSLWPEDLQLGQGEASRRGWGIGTVRLWASCLCSSAKGARMKTSQSRTSSGGDGLQKGLIGFMLPHEQFPVPELIDIGAAAARSGFGLLAASDHFQPWQSNEGHSGQAWVTLAALWDRIPEVWAGTTVTCPILRYNPAVIAEAFASLSLLHPGRIFLGVGSGEALNEQAATGQWPDWEGRWERLIEAIRIIRALWSGEPVRFTGKHYSVDAK